MAVVLLGTFFFSFCLHGQDSSHLQTLHGHVPHAIGRFHLQPLSDLPSTNRLKLAIGLPLRNQPALDALLQQIYDPASTNYHHYLAPEQFTAQFGPAQPDYDAVIRFAISNGLEVTGTYPNRALVDVSGDVATVEKVFHTTLHLYQHPTENRRFYAPDTDPSIDLNVSVFHISGLDNFVLPRPAIVRLQPLKNIPSGVKAASGSGPGGLYMGKDFHAAYTPGVTLNGSGQSLGLLELEGYYPTDIATYEADAGLPDTLLTNIDIDGFGGEPLTGDTNGITEVSLDIEMAISMATNLSKVIVYEAANTDSDTPVSDLLARMASDDLAKQISSSWLIDDDPNYDTSYKQMAMQGQSFFQASGDNGAFYSGISEWADDTNITLVGGTTLSTTGGGAWSSETVWNWYSTGEGDGGSGGGINFNSIPIPNWQQGINMSTNQGSTTLRNVPDVALTADNIFVVVTNTSFSVGGTSCAAPLWAGFTALMNQQAAATGRSSVGFLNPAIYALGKSAGYTNAFHDIVTGNNTNLTVHGKYFAVPGYDLCTGWGTPNGQNLINALAPPDSILIIPSSGFNSSGYLGGPFAPDSQIYTLTNVGSASLTWSLINTSSWLSASTSSGTLAAGSATPVTISVNSAADSLTSGVYDATLTFTNHVSNFAQNFTFRLQIADSLGLSPANGLAAAGATGGPFYPVSQNFSLTNAASVPLTWQVSSSGAPWLNLSPSSGTLANGASAKLTATLNANANALPAGIYTTQISVTDETTLVVQSGSFTLSVGQNIVLNGGFETGDFTDWSFNGNTSDTIVDNGSATGISPHSGSWFAALGNPRTLATLSQTLTTIPNQSYLLSLWFNSPNVLNLSQAQYYGLTVNTPNQFKVSWNGATLFNQSNIAPINGWTNLLFVVTATSSSTSLQFGERVDPWVFGLDDVSVLPIPTSNVRSSVFSPNSITLNVNSLPGLVYEVQYSTNLLSTNWFNLSTNTASASTLSITNPLGANSFLFYRVLRLP